MFKRVLLPCVLLAVCGPVTAQRQWVKRAELYPAEGYGATNNHFGASLSVRDGLALVGSPGLDSEEGTAYLFERQGASWIQTEQWWTITSGDDFGSAVAVSESTALVGAPGFADGSGSIHILEHVGQEWLHGPNLGLSAPVSGAHLGASLTVVGDDAFAGAPGIGAVYSIRRVDGIWTLGAELRPSTLEQGFGESLDFDGARVVIGSSDENAVYVFERAGLYWFEAARLIPAEEEEELGGFGYSVALDGERILVGAPGDEGEGRAYLFEHGPSGWPQSAVLVAAGVEPDMEFGTDVALSSDMAVVGSPGDEVSLGAAYVFELSDSTWVETAQLVPEAQPGEINYAYNVAIVDGAVMLNIGLDDSPVIGVYAGAVQIWLPSPRWIRRAFLRAF